MPDTELHCTQPAELRGIGKGGLPYIRYVELVPRRSPASQRITHQCRIRKKEIYITISKRHIHAAKCGQARVTRDLEKTK